MRYLKMMTFVTLSLAVLSVYALPCETTSVDTKKGDSISDVIQRCGQPTSKETLGSSTVKITEMKYLSPTTWIFEDGILTDWAN